MKRLLVALALLLGVSRVAMADSIPTIVDNATIGAQTQTVFNNAGSALTSGSVVVWDKSTTSFTTSGYRYVTTSTTVDAPYVAGVTLNGTCPDQSLCEIVVKGPAITRIANSTDGITVDKLVSTTTVAGQAGDYTAAADSCFLGIAMKIRSTDTGATAGVAQDNVNMMVYVQPGCE